MLHPPKEQLGVSTTTSTTAWFVTTASEELAEQREIFRTNVKRDGWLMAVEFQAWLRGQQVMVSCGKNGEHFDSTNLRYKKIKKVSHPYLG